MGRNRLWDRLTSAFRRADETRPSATIARMETLTLVAVVLESYSGKLEERGPYAVIEMLEEIDRRIDFACQGRGGVVIRRFTGTGVMGFSLPGAALEAAWAVVKPSGANERSLPLLCAVHTGPVVTDGRRWFGSSIDTAAFLCRWHPAATVLHAKSAIKVSGPTMTLARGQAPSDLRLLRAGECQIKGMTDPLEMFLLVGQTADASAFISYRRGGGAEAARLIRTELKRRGFRTFLDVDDMNTPRYFDDRLAQEIATARNFILVLSPGSLDRCDDDNDWLRREIRSALRSGRNIVPVLMDGFVFPTALPNDLLALPRYNCVPYSHQYFSATIDRIANHLV